MSHTSFGQIALYVIATALALAGTACSTATPAASRALDEPVVVERGVTFCVADGVELRQDVVRAARPLENVPAIIYVPGGGWQTWTPRVAASADDAADDRTGRPDLTYAPLVRHLATRGFIVFIVYPRGGPAHRFPAHVKDVKCAVRSLRANAVRYGIDPARVGIVGGSSGGHIAALVALADTAGEWDSGPHAAHSSRVQAAVVAAAPTDLTGPIPPEHAPLFASVFGTADAGAPVLVAATASTYATPDDPPVLLLHGSEDLTVPVSQSEQFLARLVRAGVRARLVVVRGGGHGVLWPDERAETSPSAAEVRALVSAFFEASLGASEGF